MVILIKASIKHLWDAVIACTTIEGIYSGLKLLLTQNAKIGTILTSHVTSFSTQTFNSHATQHQSNPFSTFYLLQPKQAFQQPLKNNLKKIYICFLLNISVSLI